MRKEYSKNAKTEGDSDMGTSIILVKMPNGKIKFGNYQNTSDSCFNRLFDTLGDREAALAGHTDKNRLMNCKTTKEAFEKTEVDVFCDYGSGFHWKAFTDKEGKCLVDRLTPSGGREESFGYWPEEDESSWRCIFEIPEWVRSFYKKSNTPSMNPELHARS